MTPENKGRALFLFGLTLGIGSGWVISREHVRRQRRTLEAKKQNVTWVQNKKVENHS